MIVCFLLFLSSFLCLFAKGEGITVYCIFCLQNPKESQCVLLINNGTRSNGEALEDGRQQ
jgi:hypothetical protein